MVLSHDNFTILSSKGCDRWVFVSFENRVVLNQTQNRNIAGWARIFQALCRSPLTDSMKQSKHHACKSMQTRHGMTRKEGGGRLQKSSRSGHCRRRTGGEGESKLTLTTVPPPPPRGGRQGSRRTLWLSCSPSSSSTILPCPAALARPSSLELAGPERACCPANTHTQPTFYLSAQSVLTFPGRVVVASMSYSYVRSAVSSRIYIPPPLSLDCRVPSLCLCYRVVYSTGGGGVVQGVKVQGGGRPGSNRPGRYNVRTLST